MFYIVSKLLSWLLYPFYWIVFLFLLSIFIKSNRFKFGLRLSSIILFFIFGNRAILNGVYTWNETQPLSQESIKDPYPYAVVLGGGFAQFNPRFPDRIMFRDHINRLTESMELFQSGKIKKLIISGGQGSLSSNQQIEAQYVRSFLLENNWPDSSILIEPTSRNTFENARNVKSILDSLKVNAPILLITSAMHMPRAQACFKKQGIAFTAYPADYRQRDQLGWSNYFIPELSCFDEWQAVIKEWIGIVAYRIKGYID